MENKNENEKTGINHISHFTRTIIDIRDLEKVLKKNANHGVCGGYNLGNTCFMNSSIACLSNCTELTTFFLTEKYKQSINKNNKLGLGGKLAKAWYNLLEEYWNSKSSTGNPSDVKSCVAKKYRKFGGYEQQDSNEFMTEFLSILSEDLNKVDKKNYLELKEKQDNETILQCAERFWNNYQKNNDSIITDLFSGLLKNDVICSKCGFDNVTFDPFNTLVLPIPDHSYLRKKKAPYMDLELFYIPKYSIKTNCRIFIHIKRDTPFKDMATEINKIEGFNYNLKKLVFIKVMDSKLQEIVNENECKNISIREHIFAFDDESKEGENNIIYPLYMYKNKNISAFPRLLFLNENMTFGELKKLIYYFARNNFISPLKNRTDEGDEDLNKIYQLDEELKKYKEENEGNEKADKEKVPYDENKLWELFSKEYNIIFNDNKEKYKEELENFFNDFPYKITLKKNFDDTEDLILFDGKNNEENLKLLQISKDEDPIKVLLENKNFCLNLILNPLSHNSIPKINLNLCTAHRGKDVGKNYEFDLTLDDLLDFFCSNETIEKEWKCAKCKEKVNITKKFSLFYLPKLLIICLKRFRGYSKNSDYIEFPLENLDMGKYICENGPDKEYSKYDLFAVSQHYGGTGGGHYTAICKNVDGNWYHYNDSSASRASPDNVVTSAAYVLFYRRKNW